MITAPNPATSKARMVDAFRKRLRQKWIEGILILISKRFPFVKRIVPPSYLYPPKTYRTVTRAGVTYRLDLKNEIGHSLYFFDRCNTSEQFLKLIKRHSVVIDIGAHVGTVALAAAAATKSGSVYAYEPNQENFDELQHNIRLNAFKNIYAIHKAVGKTTHKAQLFKPDQFEGCPTKKLTKNNLPELEWVDVTTLDDEYVRLKLDHVDIIRISAQGLELNVLLGAKNVLEKFHPILVIEFIDESFKNHGRNTVEAIQFIRNLGYSCIDLKTSMPLITGLKGEAVILCYV